MTDLSTFNPSTADELKDEIVTQLKGTATDWWNENSGVMEGYLKSLAEAAIQTRVALAEKRISEHTADIFTHMQEMNFNQTIQFTRLMTLALAQRLVDTVFSIVGWVVFNKTGINVMPHLVKPGAAGNGE